MKWVTFVIMVLFCFNAFGEEFEVPPSHVLRKMDPSDLKALRIRRDRHMEEQKKKEAERAKQNMLFSDNTSVELVQRSQALLKSYEKNARAGEIEIAMRDLESLRQALDILVRKVEAQEQRLKAKETEEFTKAMKAMGDIQKSLTTLGKGSQSEAKEVKNEKEE